MIFKSFILSFCLISLAFPCLYAEGSATAESDQQINDFSLSGYGEKGKKSWEIFGKTADVFTEDIQLDDVIGNLYGEEEDVKLTGDKGKFNKENGKLRLEDNVVITTSSGAKLTTDSLEWDRKEQVVSTKDSVNIERNSMMAVAIGAKGEPNLNKVSLEKDVRVDIKPDQAQGSKETIMITCDGPLEIEYEKNMATFYNNVKVEREDSIIYGDRLDIYFSSAGTRDSSQGFMNNKIEKIVAKGNVKIVRDENISYSQKAIYTAADKKIVLSGRPKLVISSAGDLDDASFGN
ncbi:MAG: LPS export ABC transporter periplasmic protein LptC [Candidatus Omnitrophota bacterium]